MVCTQSSTRLLKIQLQRGGGSPGLLPVLFRHAGHLRLKLTIKLNQLFVHRGGFGMETRVAANQLITLDGVFHRREQFLAQPGLDDETVDLPLVDGFDDGAQTQHRRDKDAGGVGLDLFHLGQEFSSP